MGRSKEMARWWKAASVILLLAERALRKLCLALSGDWQQQPGPIVLRWKMPGIALTSVSAIAPICVRACCKRAWQDNRWTHRRSEPAIELWYILGLNGRGIKRGDEAWQERRWTATLSFSRVFLSWLDG